MEAYRMRRGPDGRWHLSVPWRGAQLLSQPMYNKSTAFTRMERLAFELDGLLPEAVSTMEQQAERVYLNIVRKTDPLERYIGLAALQDRGEHLFFRVLVDHIEEFLPIVYTPTVGRACQEFSRIFRRARGLWITPRHRGRVDAALARAPYEDVRLIVVTDNERILGLGDQGVGGMAIPIGKLALYTAAAGIHPSQTLPISLDVGTDNPALLADPLYLGWRGPRLRGPEYDSLVDEFVQAVKRQFPRALLQWEDFKKGNAFALLHRYREVLPSFNDDIQGTAAVALGTVLSALRVTGAALRGQRILILGGGAAGIGIAQLLRTALREAGLAGEELVRALGVVEVTGLLVEGAGTLEEHQRDLAWPAAVAARAGLGAGPRDLLHVVRALKPTVLVGVAGSPGAFSPEAVREMARHVERPVVLPLSNPNSQAEATPSELLQWTEGRALVATGSPFDLVVHEGRRVQVGQANNVFVFPGVGLGALVGGLERVSDEAFLVAARALADSVTTADHEAGLLLPPVTRLRQVAARVAAAVVRQARDAGAGRAFRDDEIEPAVAAAMWDPVYPVMEPA